MYVIMLNKIIIHLAIRLSFAGFEDVSCHVVSELLSGDHSVRSLWPTASKRPGPPCSCLQELNDASNHLSSDTDPCHLASDESASLASTWRCL